MATVPRPGPLVNGPYLVDFIDKRGSIAESREVQEIGDVAALLASRGAEWSRIGFILSDGARVGIRTPGSHRHWRPPYTREHLFRLVDRANRIQATPRVMAPSQRESRDNRRHA